MSRDIPTLKEEMDRIRGRVCGLIESWNLSEKQERAAIATFKALTYDTEKVIQNEIIPQALEDFAHAVDSERKHRVGKQQSV